MKPFSKRCASFLLVILSATLTRPALAHETDQFTIPPGREFADVGPLISQWAYDAIQTGVNKVNERIKSAGNDPEALKQLQSDQAIVPAVNKGFPWAMDVIEGWEKRLNSRELQDRYPGKVLVYKHPLANIYQGGYFILDPRQVMRIWLSGTFKAFDVYLGSDKIGHFTDMGMNYWREYNKLRRAGKTPEEAQRESISVGNKGLVFSETGLLGNLTAGSYSNGDMAANFLGMQFYRNLTEPIMLKGEVRKPMLVRDGQYWRIAPHVDRDTFFSMFICDHMDEALNPSKYESAMRNNLRKKIAERAPAVLEHYADVNGQRRPREWFEKKLNDLRTYYGVDYGHAGERNELVALSDVAFAAPASANKVGKTGSDAAPTIYALASQGDAAGVRTLLGNRANANEALRLNGRYNSDWGSTPLHLAARSGGADTVQALLGAGANASAKNDLGVTPLHSAVDAADTRTIELLLSRGADVNAADVRGRTPLHWAAKLRSDSDRVIALLVGRQAKPDLADKQGRTPLHVAAEAGNDGAARALLAAGAKPGAADRMGVTPLHLAASGDKARVVELLLNRGATADVRDDLGSTPLHDAARHQARDVVALLVRSGANTAVADAYGQRPTDVARKIGDAALAGAIGDTAGSQGRAASVKIDGNDSNSIQAGHRVEATGNGSISHQR
jgi:ankyrin repeat protein